MSTNPTTVYILLTNEDLTQSKIDSICVLLK